jgi:galactose mutarotase-like enzyme
MHAPYRNVQRPKCHGPRVLKGYTLNGYEIIILENEFLRAVINVGRGAMVPELLYKPRDLDVLYKNPNGMRPHDTFTLSSYENHPLADHHPGGWYECFPSGSAPVRQEGVHIGFHGEIWGLPFELNSATESDTECSATMTAYTIRTPWKLEKTFSMKKNDPTLYLKETATNLGAIDLTVMWGQHPYFGAPFIDDKCRLELPATGFFDHSEDPMIRRRWPMDANGRDLTKVGGQKSGIGRMVFVTDFETGKYRIVSPTWNVALEMCWDADKFPYCWMYENCNQKAGWGRSYGIAVEPFTGLPKAIEEGHGVLPIKGGESETVAFEMRIVPL